MVHQVSHVSQVKKGTVAYTVEAEQGGHKDWWATREIIKVSGKERQYLFQ